MNRCFEDYGDVWCPVALALGSLSGFYFILTFYILMRHLIIFKDYSSTYMFMQYSQALETLTMALHYFLLGLDSEIFYMLQEIFLMLLATFIFYFFSCEIGKMTESQSAHKMISFPLVIINVIYVIAFSIVAIVLRLRDEYLFSCKSWIWLFSAGSGLFLSFVLLGLSFFMKRKINEMPVISKRQIDKSRHYHLWAFIGVFIISYLTMLADSIGKMAKDQDCISYTDETLGSVILFILIRLVTHYSAITYSLYVFWPRESSKIDKEFEIDTLMTPIS